MNGTDILVVEEILHFFKKNGEFTLFTFADNSGNVYRVFIFLN
jgi:hypothetical protein